MKVRSFPRSMGRLTAPLFLFLSGMAVPVALGAARGQESPSGSFGRIGIHRLIPNALVYEHEGQVRVLTYSKSAEPQRYGMITMTGDVRTWSLREAMEELAAKSRKKRGLEPAAEEEEAAAELEAEAPSRKRRKALVDDDDDE